MRDGVPRTRRELERVPIVLSREERCAALREGSAPRPSLRSRTTPPQMMELANA
jgi:hypothetical protein